MQWQAIGCSEIGSGHIKTGIPCQDFCDYQIISNNQVILGAVSDGMGSASHSDLGSKIAVQTTLKYLDQYHWLDHSIDQSQAQVFFQDLLKTVVTEIQNVAKEKDYSVRDMACTLLAFITTPNLLIAMQCGDGLIVIRPQSSQNYQLIFQPQKGEYANEYVPITSSSAHQYMQVKVIHQPIDFICAATDGIEHISLIKSKVWKAYDKFFEPIETQIMRSYKTELEKKKIVSDWLKSDDINQKTDDDKTVLLCIQASNGKQNHFNSTISPLSESTEFAEDDSLNSKPNKLENIKQYIYQLTNKQYPDIELKLSILKKNFLTLEIKILKISIISGQEVNQQYFINLLRSIDFHHYKLLIKKLNVNNINNLNNYVYWKYEFSLDFLPSEVKKILYLIIVVILMTLISTLISTFSNILLNKILIFFVYNLILIISFDVYVNQSR